MAAARAGKVAPVAWVARLQDLRVLINRIDRTVREIERNPQGFVVGEPLPYEEKKR